MKKIGFLSFGHWTPSSQSQTRSAADTLLQSVDLAVAAEELGADGAYFRVHHFARQLASPFPLLAAVGAKTSRIEIGTAVIDMRYENPLYMAEDAGAADLIAGGRLQLGISRGSPEQVIDGWRHFGYQPVEGESGEVSDGQSCWGCSRHIRSRTRDHCNLLARPHRRQPMSGMSASRPHKRTTGWIFLTHSHCASVRVRLEPKRGMTLGLICSTGLFCDFRVLSCRRPA